MDTLDLECVPRLYTIAYPKAKDFEDDLVDWSGATQIAREEFIKTLSEHSARLLGVPPPRFISLWTTEETTTKATVREWWIKVLRDAKLKASVPLVLKPGPPADPDKQIEVSTSALLKWLRTDEVRELARRKVKDLRHSDAAVQRQAVYFFHDLRARAVLLALLGSRDWRLKEAVADDCLDLFRKEDLPALYRVALDTAPDRADEAANDRDRRRSLVKRICEAAATILDVRQPVPPALTKDGVREWFAAAVSRHNAKPTRETVVDRLLKQVENQPLPVRPNPDP